MSQEGTRADDSIPVFVPTDVEFNATQHISPQEAVDVAIPPVLDEAAFALSSSDELSSSDLASMVRDSEDVGSGWSSPALPPTLPHTPRSPVRHSSARSRSPDSRSSSNPPLLPVSHAGTPTGHAAKPSYAVGAVSFPSSTTSPMDHLSSGSSIDALGESEPATRRLLFTSYADLLNEERLADRESRLSGSKEGRKLMRCVGCSAREYVWSGWDAGGEGEQCGSEGFGGSVGGAAGW